MRRIFNLISFSVLIAICLIACKKEDQSLLQASWTSKDPITIPFNNRLHQYNFENLVLNSSFESGKLFYEESSIKTFDIEGWKKIGSNIEWVNIQNIDYNSCEVFDGIHSVKVQRQIAHETEDLGEGILSDYIKVIPGNYFLKMHLKLQDINSYKERLGEKLYDAVNIRLIYFDKNKIEIDAKDFNPFESKNIDITFASLSFVNYWNIDSMDWCEIHGKTAHFPYYNGDIPDQARYVKIFIGLKGTGTLWIDNVDFRYTNQNFALLERLKPYFDSSFSVYDMLFPTPKHIEKKESLSYFNTESNLLPIIILKDSKEKSLLSEANKLKTKIESLLPENKTIEIVEDLNIDQLENYSTVFSFGVNSIYNQYNKMLPDSLLIQHANSYYIKSNPDKNIIFVNAQNEEGLRYAVLTLIQLIDKNKPLVHTADIFDYPDFKNRSYVIQEKNNSSNEILEKLNLLNNYKMGSAYLNINSNVNELAKDLNKISLLIDSDYNEALKSIKKIDHKTFNKSESVLISYKTGDLEQINDLVKRIQRRKKSISIEFIPEFNNLESINKSKGQAANYFENLRDNLPADVSIVWTGENTCSNSIDYLNISQINSLINDKVIFLDNSFFNSDLRFNSDYLKHYYSGKLRLSSLFEPYNFKTLDNFQDYNKGSKVILKLDSFNELNSISTLTASNYYWNTKDYNPDKSLWIVLNNLYGRELAINLLKFNDAVFGIIEICQKTENNGINNKDIRIAKLFKQSLIEQSEQLSGGIKNKVLLSELEKVKQEVLTKYDKVFLDVK